MKNLDYHIESHLLQLISSEQAFHYNIVPRKKETNHLILFTPLSTSNTIISELEIILGYTISLEKIDKDEFVKYLNN